MIQKLISGVIERIGSKKFALSQTLRLANSSRHILLEVSWVAFALNQQSMHTSGKQVRKMDLLPNRTYQQTNQIYLFSQGDTI